MLRAMTLVLRSLPRSLWYCRASFSAESTDSLPPLVKKTRFRPAGVSEAIFSASLIAGGCAADQIGKYSSSRAWSAPACATSARPWPMFTQNRELSASRYRFPFSSQT